MSSNITNISHIEVPSLSPTEQKIYSNLYGTRVITLGDVIQLVGSYKKSADYIHRLAQKGYFQKIRKGVYAIVPPNLVGKDFDADKILIASKLSDNYFISHHTALEIHGVAQSYFNTLFVSTNKRFTPLNYKNITINPVLTKYFFGIEKKDYLNQCITISDKERTILDCMRKIEYTGGWEELFKSFASFPYIDFDKMYEYLLKFKEYSLFSRTGFVFELLSEEIDTPSNFLKNIEKNVSKRKYYFDNYNKGKLIKPWNLIVPKTIYELVRYV
ncbi:MAG: hypothetical protein ACE5KT_02840 [Methanosarcinales archaeon]